MQCKKIKPNVDRYHLRFHYEDDPDMYHRCMWANIYLDHDTFTLFANTDCGDYSYSWPVSEHETFLHLMSRIDVNYLLSKIATKSMFNLKASKEQMIQAILEYDEGIKSNDKRLAQIIDIDDCSSEDMFYIAVAWITNDLCDFEINIIKEYQANAKTFGEVFIEYLQPILRSNDVTMITK